MRYYIASCVFTARFPELSRRIQNIMRERLGLTVVRCCVPSYRIKDFENKMPEGELRDGWQALPDSGRFGRDDEVYSLCHNCNNIIEEMHGDVKVRSLWELLDSDEGFPLPDYRGLCATIQDCWRSRDRRGEQNAVRRLLKKMNVDLVETTPNHQDTAFCGASLYRPQPPRNPKLAPKHYVQGAEGLFQPHTEAEQARLMRDYCRRFTTDKVICYCHYCLEGLRMGGVNGIHLAQMLFPEADQN